MKNDFIINPSLNEIKEYCLKSDYKFLRGFYIPDEKTYLFTDGYYITHDIFDKNIGKETIHIYSVVENDDVKLYPISITDLYNYRCISNAIYNLKNLTGIIKEKSRKDYYDTIMRNNKDIVFYKELLIQLNKNELLNDFMKYKKESNV